MNPKILIVDDQPDNLDAIVRFIEEDHSPYELLQALSAEIALSIAKKEIPDLIITDWEMPEMDGIDLIKALKSYKETKDIPVIMCTGVMLDSSDLKTALDAGAIDYIRKPIDKVELLARINSVLRLANSFKEIKELNDAKDRIFSIIAHDLRTPVGNIKSFVSWVIEQADSYDKEKIMILLRSIQQQSSSSYHTLETLLNWAKCQVGGNVFNPRNNNIIDLINEAYELFKFSIEEKDIEIIKKHPDEVIGFFDREMISTVVRNLLSNAVKYSFEGGKVQVVVSEENNKITFSVKDNGVGISRKYIDNLFDTSNYHSTYGTHEEKGSGLGLKICKEFIAKHNGKIFMKSTINKGSKFSFIIPQI